MNIICTLVSIVGFLLIAQPAAIFDGLDNHEQNSSSRIIGAFLSFSAAILCAFASVIVRKLGSGVHFTLTMLFAAWEGVLFTVVFMASAGQSMLPCLYSLAPIMGCSFFYLCGQAFQTLALQREKAGPVTVIQTSQVVFSFLFQFIFLGEVPNILCAIGASLILISCITLAMKSILKNMKKE